MDNFSLTTFPSQIKEHTKCGASSSLSQTLVESMAMKLVQVHPIFQFLLFPFPFAFPHLCVFQLPTFNGTDKALEVLPPPNEALPA